MQFIYFYNIFFHFSSFLFLHFAKSRKYFGIVGLICTINRYFEYRIRILCICLYMGTWFKYILRPPKIDFFDPPKSKLFPEV